MKRYTYKHNLLDILFSPCSVQDNPLTLTKLLLCSLFSEDFQLIEGHSKKEGKLLLFCHVAEKAAERINPHLCLMFH